MKREATAKVAAQVADAHELARRAAAGDRDAFAALYRSHADRAFALLTRLVGPDREREDLLQETFMRLHAALPRFRGDSSVMTFVYQIATHVALDHLRRRKPIDSVDRAADLDAEVDPSATPAEQTVQREQLARALALLDKLPPKQRIAFVLREVMGFSHAEVGVIVGSFAATARMRVNAAKKQLAALAAREVAR